MRKPFCLFAFAGPSFFCFFFSVIVYWVSLILDLAWD